MMKICIVCKTDKDLNEYYSDNIKKDKKKNVCKECYDSQVSQYRKTEKSKKIRKVMSKRYYSSDKGKLKIAEQSKRYNKLNGRCNKIIYNAIKENKILKGICMVCKEAKTDAHHENYNKPLEVLWLCRKHHKQLHASMNKAYETYGNILPTIKLERKIK